ncbi:MAG: hypothetical protein QW197_03535 [Candidatus Aenigmatarchaeota archaeon]
MIGTTKDKIQRIFWVIGTEINAPAANTTLVSYTVPTGTRAYIYGFEIYASEANEFLISWTSKGTTYSRRFKINTGGNIYLVDLIPLNEGLPADVNTNITITNINAGGTGSVYKASLLIATV